MIQGNIEKSDTKIDKIYFAEQAYCTKFAEKTEP
jgi:hypothetical protein